MKTMNDLLIEYSKSHQHATNRKIHLVCVPLIVFSLFGILDLIPGPISFSVFLYTFATTFYLLTKTPIKLFLLAQVFMILSFGLVLWLRVKLDLSMCLMLFLSIFILAWIGQFIGHRIENSRPSFLKDVLFLFVGPIWILMYGIK